MRRTRFMSLFFLALAAAFFFVPEFRDALRAPLFLAFGADPWQALMRAGQLDQGMLKELAREAEQKRDARTLVFVALRVGDIPEANRLADQAVALDPQLTWVYFTLSAGGRKNPDAAKHLARLRAWDPENALPYLAEAERLVESRNLGRFVPHTPQNFDQLSKETEWRQWMEKAFAAPRFDGYARRRFELERVWLRERGLARPIVVALSLASYPIPNLLNIRMYSTLMIKKLGPDAEAAGRLPEALAHYWAVAHFGERIQLQSAVLIEKLIAARVQFDAYDKLVLLLRKMGRTDEAATVEYSSQVLRQEIEGTLRGKDPLAQSSNYNWAALTVHLFAGLVNVFVLFTLISIGYVNAKRWVRPEHKGRLYQFVTTAENYAPILLFFACLGLYVSYYPYGRNFAHYVTATGEIHNFEPLFFNTLPAFELVPGQVQLPLGNPFVPYVWYALAGVAVVTLFALLTRPRA